MKVLGREVRHVAKALWACLPKFLLTVLLFFIAVDIGGLFEDDFDSRVGIGRRLAVEQYVDGSNWWSACKTRMHSCSGPWLPAEKHYCCCDPGYRYIEASSTCELLPRTTTTPAPSSESSALFCEAFYHKGHSTQSIAGDGESHGNMSAQKVRVSSDVTDSSSLDGAAQAAWGSRRLSSGSIGCGSASSGSSGRGSEPSSSGASGCTATGGSSRQARTGTSGCSQSSTGTRGCRATGTSGCETGSKGCNSGSKGCSAAAKGCDTGVHGCHSGVCGCAGSTGLGDSLLVLLLAPCVVPVAIAGIFAQALALTATATSFLLIPTVIILAAFYYGSFLALLLSGILFLAWAVLVFLRAQRCSGAMFESLRESPQSSDYD